MSADDGNAAAIAFAAAWQEGDVEAVPVPAPEPISNLKFGVQIEMLGNQLGSIPQTSPWPGPTGLRRHRRRGTSKKYLIRLLSEK